MAQPKRGQMPGGYFRRPFNSRRAACFALPQGTINDEQNFLKLLQAMPSGEDITVFSIIPRLLVSDNLLPDAGTSGT